jgi:tRNA(Ile)-lysidine synthase
VKVDQHTASLENAARQARFRALEEVALELGDLPVLLGHTASDQAETVLMRILRGTGPVGLAAIPHRRGRYLRPLLATTRAEIEAYLARIGVEAVEDPMNCDDRFLRVRVRRRFLPALREENPNLDAALCRLAESAAELAESLDFAAETLLERASVGPARDRLACAALTAAPAAVVKRALALAMGRARLGPATAKQLDAVHGLISAVPEGSAAVDLNGGRALREYGELLWVTAEGTREPENEPLAATLHMGSAETTHQFRLWRAGDRMRPERLRGRSRKLSDLFIDAKVPRRSRRHARVLVRRGDGEIVWAEHVGLAYGCDIEVSLTPLDAIAKNKT